MLLIQSTDNKIFLLKICKLVSYLVNDYKEIITSNDVLSEVIKDEKLEYDRSRT